jgi:predicted DCC family thiol-disulfide oxidoreductase YuxK
MPVSSPAVSPNGHPTPAADLHRHAILLFDGVCNLCNGFVNFVIDNDPEAHIKMAALQSEDARPYLEAFGEDPEALDSVVLIENGRLYRRSTAALRAARYLKMPWPLFYAFIAVPPPLRDAIYDWVAEYRYEWFGTRDSCRMPTPEVQAHFL